MKPGEFVALLGPNGAGKSTLLKVILGLLPVASGTALVWGAKPKKGNHRIGYMAQFHSLESSTALRARDIVGFGLDGHRWGIGWPDRHREAKIDQVLEEVDALSLAKSPLGELSGGERQRLLLAQSLVCDPEILLLDEPTASLDITHSGEVIDLIDRIRRDRGIAVLLAAHDINPLLTRIDRVLYLANGQSEVGHPDQVITSQVLSRLYNSRVEVVTALGRRFVVGAET